MFAGPASADDRGAAGVAPELHVVPLEPDAKTSTTAEDAQDQPPVWTPWLEFEPGRDKCKRQKPWPLPLWCFGLSTWPVLKARAVTAAVKGIRDHGVGSRRR
ncbi:hypothetical protein A5724_20480 [Mycobacterium sp. ACS1612]|nr:hypothetical protein A5724_20480 [Mycobacterium sp. ACS1612]